MLSIHISIGNHVDLHESRALSAVPRREPPPVAQLVDARFARGWHGEGRSRATEVRAEEPRFAVLLERAQVPAAAMGRPHDQTLAHYEAVECQPGTVATHD